MTDQPQADRSDQPTTRYSPPQEGRPPWAPDSAWPQRTPEHWFEPMPSPMTERVSQRSAGMPLLAMAFVVALLAGALGSGVTYWALDSSGRLGAGAVPVVTGSPSAPPVTPLGPDATPTPPPVDDSVVARAAEAVSPAVVTITARAGESTDPFQLPETGIGSGVIFDSAGWVLTNRHVVAGATRVTVLLHDGRSVSGTVYGEDTLTDLAIVQIEGQDLPAATIGDSSQLRPGQLAIAIGSPLGILFTNTVTSGVVSALFRSVPVTDPVTGDQHVLHNLIQTDAAINPGNSGGALVDANGTVIGINTAVAGNAQGIGFAIPINIAKPLLRQAVAGEPLVRPWIGIRYTRVNRNVADELELPVDYGALISSDGRAPAVVPDSPADDAGLEEGDIITSVNGRRIDATTTLDEILADYSPGDRLTLMLLRNGTTRQVPVTLGTRPADLR